MSKQDTLELTGRIVSVNPNATYDVEVENDHTVTCHISGKLRMEYVKLKEGDEVTVELTPYDLTRGRIIKI